MKKKWHQNFFLEKFLKLCLKRQWSVFQVVEGFVDFEVNFTLYVMLALWQ